MSQPRTFREVIDLWPSLRDLADDLGVPYVNAQVMRHRDSIASDHWAPMVASAKRRRFKGWEGVTLEALAKIKAAKAAKARSRRPKSGVPREATA